MKKQILEIFLVASLIATSTGILFYSNYKAYEYNQLKNIKAISLLSEDYKIIGKLKLPNSAVNFSLQILENEKNHITQYDYNGVPQVKIVVKKEDANNKEFKDNFKKEFDSLKKDLIQAKNNDDIKDTVNIFKDKIEKHLI